MHRPLTTIFEIVIEWAVRYVVTKVSSTKQVLDHDINNKETKLGPISLAIEGMTLTISCIFN